MKSFFFLIHKAIIRIRNNEREKKGTIKPPFKKKKKKKLKRERGVVSNSIDPKI